MTSITTLAGQTLKLMYPLMFSCYNGYQKEMKDPAMYLSPGGDFIPWLYTVTIQDQRVFQNVNGIYYQFEDKKLLRQGLQTS